MIISLLIWILVTIILVILSVIESICWLLILSPFIILFSMFEVIRDYVKKN